MGTFPTQFKFSVVTPLYKEGGRTNISDFRHISLLTSLLKSLKKFYIQNFINTMIFLIRYLEILTLSD
jgi:hypothetical protein